MAVTAVNVPINLTHSYTVPTGKRLVASFFAISNTANLQVTVNAATVAAVTITAGGAIYGNTIVHPVCANQGDVIACGDSGGVGMSGNLYDL